MRGKLKMLRAKKFLWLAITSIIVSELVSCSQGFSKDPTAVTIKKQVNLKFFSNLPDRLTGQGKLEQALLNNYIRKIQM